MGGSDGSVDTVGEFLHLGGQLLDAAGQQPEREDGCAPSAGKLGAVGDQRRVAEAGKKFAQVGVDAEEYGIELVLSRGLPRHLSSGQA